MEEAIQLPLLGPGIDGKSKAISAQKRQNLYLEVKPEKDKTSLAAYGTPGLKFWTDTSEQPSRGMWWFQAAGKLYSVHSYALLELTGNGVPVYRGSINTSSGTVSMSDNGQQLMIVDGLNGWIFEPESPELQVVGTAGPTFTVTEPGYKRQTGQFLEIQTNNPNIPAGGYVYVPSIAATAITAGQHVTITALGNTNFTLIGAPYNTIGTTFYATGPATGTGTVASADTWELDTGGAGTVPCAGTIRILNSFRQITDAGFQGGDMVVFLDSYFITNIPNTRQFQISQPYDGMTWDALQFASKESYPDDLQALAVDNGNLVLIGDISIEYWQNTGAYPFPFQRISGSPTDVGIVAPWSIARCNGNLYFLARTRRGGVSVVKMYNYQPIVVSPPDLDYIIDGYLSPGDCISFAYRFNGHEFLEMNFGAQGATWLYDATSETWSRLTSGTDSRHYALRGTQYNGQIVASDYRNGNLYQLDVETYTDNGDPIIRELITPHTFAPTSFNKLHIYRLRLDMEQGIGLVDGQGSDPQVMLQVSRDGGYTYGDEMWVSPGAMGEYLKRAEWRRLGVSRSFVFKFKISDPVKVVLINAAAYATEAAK